MRMASKEILLPKFKVLQFKLSDEVGKQYIESLLTTNLLQEFPDLTKPIHLLNYLFSDEEEFFSQEKVIEVDGDFVGIHDKILLTREGEQDLSEIEAVFDEKCKQNEVELTKELQKFSMAISSERKKRTICCTHVPFALENRMVLDNNISVCGSENCNQHDYTGRRYCRQIYSTDERENFLLNPKPKSKANNTSDDDKSATQENKFKCGACHTYSKASKRSPCTNSSCTKFQTKASKKNTMENPQNKKTIPTNKSKGIPADKDIPMMDKSIPPVTSESTVVAKPIQLPIIIPDEVCAQMKDVFVKFKSNDKARGTFLLLVKGHDLSQFTSKMLFALYHKSFPWRLQGDTIQEMRNKMKVAVKSVLREKQNEEELNAWRKYEQEEKEREAQKKKDEEKRIQSMLLEEIPPQPPTQPPTQPPKHAEMKRIPKRQNELADTINKFKQQKQQHEELHQPQVNKKEPPLCWSREQVTRPDHPDFARNFEQRLQKEQLDSRPKYHQKQNHHSAARTHQHHPPAQYHPPSQYHPPAQYQYQHPNTPIVGGPGLKGVPTMEGFMEGFQTEGWISGK